MFTASNLLTWINSKTGKKYSTRAVTVSAVKVTTGTYKTSVTLTANDQAFGFKGTMIYKYNRASLSSVVFSASRVLSIPSGSSSREIVKQLVAAGLAIDADEVVDEIITKAILTSYKTASATGTYSLKAKSGSYLYVNNLSLTVKLT